MAMGWGNFWRRHSVKLGKKYYRKKIVALLNSFIKSNSEMVAKRALSHEQAIKRILSRGLEIKTIVDVGASYGQWSIKVKPFWPDANFLLIEGNDYWLEALKETKKRNSRFDFVLAAAGQERGVTYFFKNPAHPTGGHAHHKKESESYEQVPQTTIDHEVESRDLPGPFFVKLDTHGCEKEILLGANRTLKNTNLLLVEAYNFDPGGGRERMRFHELCTFAEERNFRCIDIGEPIFRKFDQVFWQIDLFFVPLDRPEFSIKCFEM